MRRQFDIVLKYDEELIFFPGPGVAPSPSEAHVYLTFHDQLLRGSFKINS